METATYYEQDREHDRLTRGLGLIEFARTLELLSRFLPPPPATVLDVGGGAGVYAFPLTGQGHAVHLLDLMPLHVQRARARGELASITLGDARQLPYPDQVADAVLLLGPLYHLSERVDRLAALHEAWRCLKPGGVLLAAAIPHAAAILGDLTRGLPDEEYFAALRSETYRSGQYRNPGARPGYFATAYFHSPPALTAELHEAAFQDVSLYAIEGPAAVLRDPETLWADPVRRAGVLDTLRLLEQDPSLLGASPHLLAVGYRRQHD